MIGVEDNLEGGKDNKRGGSRKPRKGELKMSDRDEVWSLRDIMMTVESLKGMTAVVEDMKVGDPERVSRACNGRDRAQVMWMLQD